LLAHPELSDAAYFYNSTGPADASYAPVSNLLKMQPKDVWQTAAVSTDIVRHMDLGASASYNLFALLFTNASSAATWKIETSTLPTSGWSTRLASTAFRAGGQGTATGTRYHGFYKHASTLTDRYIQLTISDSTNTDGYFRAGRLYIGAGFQPTLNMEYGLTFGYEDGSPRTYTTAGETIPRRIEPTPVCRFTLQASGTGAEAEIYASILDLARRRAGSRDVLALLDPDDATYGGAKAYYGLFSPTLSVELPAYNLYRSTFQITGLL